MSILADHEIHRLAMAGMIEPYVPRQIRKHYSPDACAYGVASYGLTSYGYDMRLSAAAGIKWLLTGETPLDPKRPDAGIFLTLDQHDGAQGRYVILPAFGCVLGCSVETFAMPPNVCGVVLSKSTYARAFAVSLVTPLEPGWIGQVTIEIVNHAPRPVLLYLDEGICQVQFYRGNPCERPYGDGRSYQHQQGITLGRVG